MVASGKLITKLPKMADDLAVKMKKTKAKKLIPSLKRLGVIDINAHPFGKGYFGKRIKQSNPRVDAYEFSK